jgi:hypothetical protein
MSHHGREYADGVDEDLEGAYREIDWLQGERHNLKRALANLACASAADFERWAESAQTGEGLLKTLIDRFGK